MPSKRRKCVIERCEAQYRPGGCEYLKAHTPCAHPAWKEEWAAENTSRESLDLWWLAAWNEYQKGLDKTAPPVL